MRELIVAIDGPSGAGKSTLSKLLALRLGYTNIDTGAMYRAVALAAGRQGVDPEDGVALKLLCEGITISFVRADGQERVLLNGEDVSAEIRTPENSLLTSRISACPQVRESMVRLQREMGRSGGVVLEGRDIGSVVFPQAEAKFFLSATAQERGSRRYKELKAKGMDVGLDQTIAEVEARDLADSKRSHSPLIQPQDAVVIDSTALDIEGVLALMLDVIEERRRAAGLGELPSQGSALQHDH